METVRLRLQGLGLQPSFEDIANKTISLKTAIVALDLWSDARLVGPLAEIRRRQVTRELTNAVFARMCGKTWADAERAFLENPKMESTLDALLRKVCATGGFGVVIRRDYAKFVGADSVDWYADLSQRYKVCTDRKLCEFAIRLTFEPQTMVRIPGPEMDELEKQVASNPEVMRGARFGALLCSAFLPLESVPFAWGGK